FSSSGSSPKRSASSSSQSSSSQSSSSHSSSSQSGYCTSSPFPSRTCAFLLLLPSSISFTVTSNFHSSPKSNRYSHRSPFFMLSFSSTALSSLFIPSSSGE